MLLSIEARLNLCKLLYAMTVLHCVPSIGMYSRLLCYCNVSINYGVHKIRHGDREGGIPVPTASTQQAHKKRKTP